MSIRPSRIASALALGAVLAVAGCAARAETPQLSPGRDFVDVFSADVAAGADGLVWAIAGRVRGRRGLHVAVYRRPRDGAWARAPRLSRGLDPGAQPSLADLGGVPYIGYEVDEGGLVLACLRSGRWVSLPAAGLPHGAMKLSKLVTLGDKLVAAFSAPPPNSRTLVLRLDGMRWRPLGVAIRTHGAIATLGESSDSDTTLDLALLDVPRRRRTVLTLRSGAWHRGTRLDGLGAGPMPGGPVRLGDRVYLPVVDASTTPWRFTARMLRGGRWAPVGGVLNRGPGNAQGVLRTDGRAVWATWQQNALRRDGRFDTRIYAQRVAPRRASARLVWQGVTIGPGNVETVGDDADRFVLYMPAAAGGGLTARVEPLP